ncbi:hypothetical protein AB1K70_25375 [Bremerella sp. JC770]|uniref:hypothetical protein n=1 Tax=Bremerella sp. JC770 TaxID=3232137 RepID=UPI0034578473
MADDLLTRDFDLDHQLFSPNSPWNGKIGRLSENENTPERPVLPESELQCYATFEILRWASFAEIAQKATGCAPNLEKLRQQFDEIGSPLGAGQLSTPSVSVETFTFPIFDAGDERSNIPVQRYGESPDRRLPGFPTVTVEHRLEGDVSVAQDIPHPATCIRPSDPADNGSDGSMILLDRSTSTEYDFWQATVRDFNGAPQFAGSTGDRILAAGAIARFDYSHDTGLGLTNVEEGRRNSGRASGLPYLGGLIIPENFKQQGHLPEADLSQFDLGHALAFALPAMRYLASRRLGHGLCDLANDVVFPATSSETSYGTVNPFALASGQRIRLKKSIRNRFGNPLNENELRPITRLFLNTLRRFGAYLVDGGLGFGFAAEDYHTAKVTLQPNEIEWLVTTPDGSPAERIEGETDWQFLMAALSEDLFQNQFVFAAHVEQGFIESNFDVVR